MSRTSAAVAAATAVGYAALFRLGAMWGATPAERKKPLPGDGLVPGRDAVDHARHHDRRLT